MTRLLGSGHGRARRSGKIVATHGVPSEGGDLKHAVHAALAPGGIALRLQERDQNCQRKGCVTALRYLIESHRQLRLFRKRAVPLAMLVEDPPKLPLRQ